MNRWMWVGLWAARTLRLVIAAELLVSAGRVFNADAQTETVLYSFGSSPNDGNQPQFGLVQGSDGDFYGTTAAGGTYNSGAVFRISPSGTYTTLYSFAGYRNHDGANPEAGLVQGNDGNFYGTTYSGSGGIENYGTVFRISPSGSYSNLYDFGSHADDGVNPQAGLVQGGDGNFYGTTLYAGNPICYLGCGTVFRISPSGTYTTLYSFAGSPTDGSYPQTGLVQGSDGNFYGTTIESGASGCGIVFRISPSGSETNLHSLGSYPTDGEFPYGGLVQGSDGNFYGTTYNGGASTNCFGGPCGTVYRINPDGSESTVYSFGASSSDGAIPEAGLVQGSDGNFYGTTLYGGTYNHGTVFKLTVPLSPPANQISAVRIAGKDVTITIPSIAYETYQLQFSSSMNPTNWVNVPGVSITNSIGALLTVTNFGGSVGPQGFYRFDITP